jgi:hypothetical protein
VRSFASTGYELLVCLFQETTTFALSRSHLLEMEWHIQHMA